jgi:hypothetical protein
MPATGHVRRGEFSYFLYRSTCTNCSIIISLSSYSSGDPDLYIIKGDRLPTLEDYDFRSSTLSQEVVTLSPETPFMKDKGYTSMEGYYVIGVFGSKNTTF